MHELTLLKPINKYADAIMEYRQVFLDQEDDLAGCGNLRECDSAIMWIEGLKKLENTETCPKDKVPSTTYLAIRKSDDKVIGIIDFRHHINHHILRVWGGHIGYSIHPFERRKGYAKAMLGLILPIIKEHGLDKVLVTCDQDNIASKKTIIANSGVFEKPIDVDGKTMERYWIHL